MSANTSPIWSLTPNIGAAKIATTSAVAQSDGAATGTSTNLMYSVFASGANGSFLQKVRFSTVASTAATNSVATTLRIFKSSVSTTVGTAAGATTASNTMLIAEISVPIISAGHSINATPYYDVPINLALPASCWILVAQHIAQTTNQSWQAQAFGGDY